MPEPVRLRALLTELLDLTNAGPPSAAQLDEHLRGRASVRTVAGPNLSMPPWAREVGSGQDVYLGFEGEVSGIHLHEDPRGWGAYANLSVSHGSLDDVESVVGPTRWMARNPDDFTSGERVAAYVDRSGWTIRVFTELGRDNRTVRFVSLSYPSRDTAPRPAGEPSLLTIRQPERPPYVPPRDQSQPPPKPPPPPPSIMREERPPAAGDPSPPVATPDRCPNCGADTANAGSFCGTCGAFLEWS